MSEPAANLKLSHRDEALDVDQKSFQQNKRARLATNSESIAESQIAEVKKPEEKIGDDSGGIIRGISSQPQPKSKHVSRRDAAEFSKSRKGKEKKDRKSKTRNRGSRNEETAQVSTQPAGEEISKAPRLPKRQCALLIGFCGTGCNGMQMSVSYVHVVVVLY